MGETKIISIDFDGTIVREEWPAIGPEIPGAMAAIRRLWKAGHGLILNTCREGRELDRAIQYLNTRGVLNCFSAINNHHPRVIKKYGSAPRKLTADVYIDDRNFGGFPGWGAVLGVYAPVKPLSESELDEVFEPIGREAK